MKLLLTQTVDKLGRTGDIVTVADGYGRNYLIPKRFAILANERNVKEFEHKKRTLEQKRQQELLEAKDFATKIEATQVTITRRAGENEKLFGSVTNQDIAEALKTEGVEVDRKSIVLGEPIKTLGYHTVTVKVAPEVEAPLKIWVVGEE